MGLWLTEGAGVLVAIEDHGRLDMLITRKLSKSGLDCTRTHLLVSFLLTNELPPSSSRRQTRYHSGPCKDPPGPPYFNPTLPLHETIDFQLGAPPIQPCSANPLHEHLLVWKQIRQGSVLFRRIPFTMLWQHEARSEKETPSMTIPPLEKKLTTYWFEREPYHITQEAARWRRPSLNACEHDLED